MPNASPAANNQPPLAAPASLLLQALQRELDFDLEADALDALGGGEDSGGLHHAPYRGASTDGYPNGLNGTSDLDAYSPTDAYGSAAPFDPAAEAEAARRERGAADPPAPNGLRP